MNKVLRCLVTLMLLGASPAFAQSDGKNDTPVKTSAVVISANKIETSSDKITATVSSISGEDIEAKQVISLTDMLDAMPGIFYNTQGGVGQYSTISIRGAATRYTQFRFDDFPLRDVTGTQADFSMFTSDLLFTPGAMGSIEVLKGAQGTMYGSNAMGGVISLYPQKWGNGQQTSFRLARAATIPTLPTLLFRTPMMNTM